MNPRAVRVSLGPALADLASEPIVVDAPDRALVDGEPVSATLMRFDPVHAVVETGGARHRVLLLPPTPPRGAAGEEREVIVDGWRIVVTTESERHASLRSRARRGRATAAAGGVTEVRAVIPGRILAVSAQEGDTVTAGQPVIIIEAMKMQNELRAPRDGTVQRVAVAAGETIELGDLLLVLE